MSERNFGSLTEFCVHLAEASVAVEIAERHALKKVAKLIETDAKERIGEYQEGAGPFGAWARLAESTEEEKARLGFPANSPLLRTGGLRESITHEVNGLEAVVGSMSDIAAYQEFGTDKIPPRPFIGPAAFSNKEKIQRIVGEAIVEGLIGGSAIHKSLGYDFKT